MNEETQVRGCYSITFICASQVGLSPTKPGAAIRMQSEPKLPTCSRTKIKARCEHGNIHHLYKRETTEQKAVKNNCLQALPESEA